MASMTAAQFRLAFFLLFLLGLIILAYVVIPKPYPQDPDYHDFADVRTIVTPNGLNVLSNLFFLAGAIYGFANLRTIRANLREDDSVWPVAIYLLGLVATTFGSGWYHYTPNNFTLVADRAGITVALAAFTAMLLADRVRLHTNVLLAAFSLAAVATVVFWYLGEKRGAGDLRPYGIVQALPIATLAFTQLTMPRGYTRGGLLWGVVALYMVARLCESNDCEIYKCLGFVSGHTLKHVAAAAASALIVYWLVKRQPSAGGLGELSPTAGE